VLWPENKIIYEIYSYVSGQHIMASETPVDLNLIPVFKMMDFMGVKKMDQLYCVSLIQKAYHEALKVAMRKKKP